MLSYLKGRQQYVTINNIQSNLLDIISGVSEGSIGGLILSIFQLMTYFISSKTLIYSYLFRLQYFSYLGEETFRFN